MKTVYLVKILFGHKFDDVYESFIVEDKTRAYELAEEHCKLAQDCEEEEWKRSIFYRVNSILCYE